MNSLVSRTLLCCAFLACWGLQHGRAQSTAPQRVALRVANLTSEERDDLSNDLQKRGDLRISFACVPAGILILESLNPERPADSLRAMALSALITRLPAQRRTEVALSLSEAEDLCAAARNH